MKWTEVDVWVATDDATDDAIESATENETYADTTLVAPGMVLVVRCETQDACQDVLRLLEDARGDADPCGVLG